MISSNFTNRMAPCQKGFLLLEALVALCALAILMSVVATWYTHSLLAQKAVCERIEATVLASSWLSSLQAERKAPQAGAKKIENYIVQTIVTRDPQQPRFYWVKVQVQKNKSEVVLVELVSGVAT